ncbi:DUF3857 domain-containing protein [candidate division KSB1 bacterium]|nr:DUF3857 domain-containing protein [candidate division KSB1 bacterium]
MRTYVLLFSLLFATLFIAQAEPKWGKVEKKILKQNVFEPDSSADAVILFDFCEMQFDQNFTLECEYWRRVKILTEKGKERADVKITYWHEDKVDDIKAQTIQPNGKKLKLDDDNVFIEELSNDVRQAVFAIPGAQVGSVIEYKYKLRSKYLSFLEPWRFQSDIYTVLSEICVDLPPGFHYSSFMYNTPPSMSDPKVKKVLNPFTKQQNSRYTWTLNHMPAIPQEPYMRAPHDYLAALYFQLVEYRDGLHAVKFANSWEELAKNIYESYESHLDIDKGLKELAFQVAPDSLLSIHRIKALYEFVRSQIETQDRFRIYAKELPHKVWEKKLGTPTEKNLLLVNLLRQRGFEAHPVLISTRNNGRVVPQWPQLRQFNYAIVWIQTPSGSYFMDTSDPYCCFEQLPPYAFSDMGLLIKKKNGKMIKIPEPQDLHHVYIETQASITELGDLQAVSTLRYEGYRARSLRNKLESLEPLAYYQDYLGERLTALKIDSVKVSNLNDIELPVIVNLSFEVPAYVQTSGDYIYLAPPSLQKLTSHPLPSLTRTFPVDFDYPVSTTETMTIEVPQGYRVEEPAPLTVVRGPKINMGMTCKQDSSCLVIERSLVRELNSYKVEQYSDLREFYTLVLDADQVQIVLTKQQGE